MRKKTRRGRKRIKTDSTTEGGKDKIEVVQNEIPNSMETQVFNESLKKTDVYSNVPVVYVTDLKYSNNEYYLKILSDSGKQQKTEKPEKKYKCGEDYKVTANGCILEKIFCNINGDNDEALDYEFEDNEIIKENGDMMDICNENSNNELSDDGGNENLNYEQDHSESETSDDDDQSYNSKSYDEDENNFEDEPLSSDYFKNAKVSVCEKNIKITISRPVERVENNSNSKLTNEESSSHITNATNRSEYLSRPKSIDKSSVNSEIISESEENCKKTFTKSNLSLVITKPNFLSSKKVPSNSDYNCNNRSEQSSNFKISNNYETTQYSNSKNDELRILKFKSVDNSKVIEKPKPENFFDENLMRIISTDDIFFYNTYVCKKPHEKWNGNGIFAESQLAFSDEEDLISMKSEINDSDTLESQPNGENSYFEEETTPTNSVERIPSLFDIEIPFKNNVPIKDNVLIQNNVQLNPSVYFSTNSSSNDFVGENSVQCTASSPESLDPVEDILDTICKDHFSTSCVNVRCSKCHSKIELLNRIKKMPQQHQVRLYETCKKSVYQFKCLFSCFIEINKTVPFSKVILCDMVNDIFEVFEGSFVDKTSYVREIVDALLSIGLNFSQAIKHIVSRYGTCHTAICDISFFLASENSTDGFDCDLIERITYCRKEKLDPNVVSNLLKYALINKKFDLIEKINQFIIHENLVDLSKIPENLVDPLQRETIKSPSVVSESPAFSYVSGYNRSILADGECCESIRSFGTVRSEEKEDFQYPNRINSSRLSPSYSETTGIQTFRNNSQNGDIFKLPQTMSFKRSTSSIQNNIITDTDERVQGFNNFLSRQASSYNLITHPDKQIHLHRDYNCYKSIHNLCPEVPECSFTIGSSDLTVLKNSVENGNAEMFLELMQKYSDSNVIEDFIVNTFVLFRKISISKIKQKLKILLTGIELIEPDCRNTKHIKIITEVLMMNLINFLCEKSAMGDARDILIFSKDYHSLLTSKIFSNHNERSSVSHMARYILVVKMLIIAGDVPLANEFLQNNFVKLVEHSSKWPYAFNERDINDRNNMLCLFLEEGALKNIVCVNDLMTHIVLVVDGCLEDMDIWKPWNEIIIELIQKGDEQKSTLDKLMGSIINHYGRFMNRNILHALLLHMHDKLCWRQITDLFKLCIKRGIYEQYNGTEEKIVIYTNMSELELKLIISCYFENILKRIVGIHDFLIKFELPKNDVLTYPKFLKHFIKDRSLSSVFMNIQSILRNYGIHITQDFSATMEITKQMQNRIFGDQSIVGR